MKSGLFNDTFFDDKISNSTVKLYESVGLMPMIECAEESAKDFLHFL